MYLFRYAVLLSNNTDLRQTKVAIFAYRNNLKTWQKIKFRARVIKLILLFVTSSTSDAADGANSRPPRKTTTRHVDDDATKPPVYGLIGDYCESDRECHPEHSACVDYACQCEEMFTRNAMGTLCEGRQRQVSTSFLSPAAAVYVK